MKEQIVKITLEGYNESKEQMKDLRKELEQLNESIERCNELLKSVSSYLTQK